MSVQADVREVANYIRALQHGLDRLAVFPLALRLIRKMHGHHLLSVQGETRTPGELRRNQNWIGPLGCTLNEATYVPPPAVETSEGLDALEKSLHALPHLPPTVRLGPIHYPFEVFNPFVDGNGRTARFLVTLLLCALGRLLDPLPYLSAFLRAYRTEYYQRLSGVGQTVTRRRWLVFFLHGVTEQAHDVVSAGTVFAGTERGLLQPAQGGSYGQTFASTGRPTLCSTSDHRTPG